MREVGDKDRGGFGEGQERVFLDRGVGGEDATGESRG